jgi:hypothetical protein
VGQKKRERERNKKEKKEKETGQLPFQSTVSKRLLCRVYGSALKARREKKLLLQILVN